jgi:hypothetical protein
MKIKYIETEDKLSQYDHGVEFHYWDSTNERERFIPGEPVAFLGISGIWKNIH